MLDEKCIRCKHYRDLDWMKVKTPDDMLLRDPLVSTPGGYAELRGVCLVMSGGYIYRDELRTLATGWYLSELETCKGKHFEHKNPHNLDWRIT